MRAPPAHPRRVQRDRRCSLAFGLLTILPSRRSVPISSERASSNLREAPPLACKIELEHGSRKPLDRDITEMCALGTGTSGRHNKFQLSDFQAYEFPLAFWHPELCSCKCNHFQPRWHPRLGGAASGGASH